MCLENCIVMERNLNEVISALSESIGKPQPGLRSRSCFELLISAILSAQTTDAQVNQVTEGLFERFPDAGSMAVASKGELEKLIYSTGFYRAKAANIRGAARMLIERYNGEVPATMGELIVLPGVGRKVANVIIGGCFGKPAIIVDTHFARVVKRIGLTEASDPAKIEKTVKALVPEEKQYLFSMLLYRHGQSVCKARKPECEDCAIRAYCWYYKNEQRKQDKNGRD